MNCIIIDDDELSRKLLEGYVKKINFLNLVKIFPDAGAAMEFLKRTSTIDLIFLDIEMPEMTGIGFLQALKTLPQVVIISSKNNYALEAFEYDVTDYITKPVSYSRLYKAVDKALYNMKRFGQTPTDTIEGIFIRKTATSLHKLDYDEILWVEALENYVVINTFDSKYTILFTMKSMLSRLPIEKFERIHRSYIINIAKIATIEDDFVYFNMDTGRKSLPIAKTYKAKLMSKINLIT